MTQPTREQKRFQLEQAKIALRRICEAWSTAHEAAVAFACAGGSFGEGRSSKGDHSDATGNKAMQHDTAAEWLNDVRALLRDFRPENERRYVKALTYLVEKWPPVAPKVLDRLIELSSVAAREWPPKPLKGEVIDGVKVGERITTLETCAECKGGIVGGAIDPIRRLDGKPYHLAPCYHTVRRRRQRMSHQ
jgi:hypothetical protein